MSLKELPKRDRIPVGFWVFLLAVAWMLFWAIKIARLSL